MTQTTEADHVEIVRDQIFAAPNGRVLLADLYLPTQPAGPGAARHARPVIVWIHGGGFRIGDRTLAPDLGRFFASRGFAMVSIDYRLSGEAVFPAALEDVEAALRWLAAEADRWALDADRVGLWGSSAGGYLAAMAALTEPGLFGGATGARARIRAVVEGYGPIDFLQMDAHRTADPPQGTDPESRHLPNVLSSAADSPESSFLGAPIETIPDIVARANPLTYAGSGAPPFLILHGLADTSIPSHQSILLFETLARLGTEATLALIEGLGHAFLNRNHLDDSGPHRMHLRTAGAGAETESRIVSQPVFTTIERFFDHHLRHQPRQGSSRDA